jgi:hypothetical protein
MNNGNGNGNEDPYEVVATSARVELHVPLALDVRNVQTDTQSIEYVIATVNLN